MKSQEIITSPILNFLETVEEEANRKEKYTHEIFKGETSQVAGQIALWYEKVRTAVQYKEEHLLRRTAIYRILNRLVIIEQRRKEREIVYALFTELGLAGYINKNESHDGNFLRIEEILAKYLIAFKYISQYKDNPTQTLRTRRWLLNMAAEEIENTINPQREKMALIYSIYEIIRPRLKFSLERTPYPIAGSKGKGIEDIAEEYLGVGSLVEPLTEPFGKKRKAKDASFDEEKLLNMLTYIAIFRALRRSDRTMLRSLLFNIYFPRWIELRASDEGEIEEIMKEYLKKRNEIDRVAEHSLVPRILLVLKKYMLCASFLFEAVMENPKEAKDIVNQEYIFREQIREKCNLRYQRDKKKLRKRIVRGIMYIFITKMFVALLLEIPYDILKEGSINYGSFLINLTIPPVLLAAIASSAKHPDQTNTNEIIKGTNILVYRNNQEEELVDMNVKDKESTVAERFLDLFYIITFLGAFTSLVYVLKHFNFNIVAITIFIIFSGTVSFFGALIRQSIRDLIVTKDREGFLNLIFDTILLPFVRFGRLISVKFARINVFIFILDFLVEAPFKFIIRAFEAWINFLRRKREEIDIQLD